MSARVSLRISASAAKPWESFQKRLDERRTFLENTRNVNVRRLKTDIERISKRETEYVKKLVEEMVPVKIVWNEEVAKKWAENVPFTVEMIEKKDEPIDI